MAEFTHSTYPAFSRRARQVVILSSALEKIATGAADAQALAFAALEQADAFDWNLRAATIDRAKEPSARIAGQEKK